MKPKTSSAMARLVFLLTTAVLGWYGISRLALCVNEAVAIMSIAVLPRLSVGDETLRLCSAVNDSPNSRS